MLKILLIVISIISSSNLYAKVTNLDVVLVKVWGPTGIKKGQFRNPYGISFDEINKNVFVSDCLNNTIKKYSLDGTLLKEWGSKGKGAGEFNYPAEVLVTSKRELLVADEKNHRIHKYDLDGNFIGWFNDYGYGSENGQLKNPLGMAEDSKGS